MMFGSREWDGKGERQERGRGRGGGYSSSVLDSLQWVVGTTDD